MTYLPSLIKKIDNFVILAESLVRLKKMAAPPETWTMEDDPGEEDESLPGDEFSGLYAKVMDVINEIRGTEANEDIADELQLVAELYKKTLEINGGYAEMQKFISRSMATIDFFIDESEGAISADVRELADEVLEDLSSDLRQRAKNPIGPQMPEAEAALILKGVKSDFNSEEARREVASQKSVYERGKPGQETGHTITRKSAETPSKYNKEIARLRESLNTETNATNRKNIEELITTLRLLIGTMQTVESLKGDLKVAPDDQETIQKFNEATAKLEELREARLTYRRKLNESILKDEQTQLRRRMYETNNPKEKEWLDEQVRLLDLRMNAKLLRKRDMIKALKARINSTGVVDEHGDFQALTMPDATREALSAALEAGREKTITKEDYDRKQTIERAKGHGKIGPVPVRQKGRAGGGRAGERIHQYDMATGTFQGIVDKFSEKVSTAAHVARLNVTQYTQNVGGKKTKLHNELKPLVEAISKSIQNASKIKEKLRVETDPAKVQKLKELWTVEHQNRYAAVKKLKEQIASDLSRWAERTKPAEALGKNVIWLPHFIKIRDELVKIASWKTESGWRLTEPQQRFISDTLRSAEKLLHRYDVFYGGQAKKRGLTPLEMSFEASTQYLGQVLDVLSDETGITAEDSSVQYRISDPMRIAEPEEEPMEEEEESNPQKRMKALEQFMGKK